MFESRNLQLERHVVTSIPTARSATIRCRDGQWTGVVYDAKTRTQFNVHKVKDGWNVSDNRGVNFRDFTLVGALRRAIDHNTEPDWEKLV